MTEPFDERVPSTVSIEQVLGGWLRRQASLGARLVAHHFARGCNLGDGLRALRRFLLLEEGLLFEALGASLFPALASNAADASWLGAPWFWQHYEAAAKVADVDGDPWFNRLRVALAPSESGGGNGGGRGKAERMDSPSCVALAALSRLRVTVDLEWPLDVVMTPDAVQRYSKIHAFLLQTKMVAFALREAWVRAAPALRGRRRSAALQRLVVHRQRMSHFMSTLHGYLASQALMESWSVLCADVERVAPGTLSSDGEERNRPTARNRDESEGRNGAGLPHDAAVGTSDHVAAAVDAAMAAHAERLGAALEMRSDVAREDAEAPEVGPEAAEEAVVDAEGSVLRAAGEGAAARARRMWRALESSAEPEALRTARVRAQARGARRAVTEAAPGGVVAEALKRAHGRYVSRVSTRCFQDPRQPRLREVLQSVFRFVLRWCDTVAPLLQAGNAEEEARLAGELDRCFAGFEQYTRFLRTILQRLCDRGAQAAHMRDWMLRLDFSGYFARQEAKPKA